MQFAELFQAGRPRRGAIDRKDTVRKDTVMKASSWVSPFFYTRMGFSRVLLGGRPMGRTQEEASWPADLALPEQEEEGVFKL